MARVVFGILLFITVQGELAAEPNPKIKFIENRNQWDQRVQFASQLRGGTMTLQPGNFGYHIVDYGKVEEIHERRHHANNDGVPMEDDQIDVEYIEVRFKGSNVHAEVIPFGKQTQYYNFFCGADPARWAGGVAAYSGVYYENFYNRIDLKVYEAGANVKYDFLVEPGGDPSQIEFEYDGMVSVAKENGDLVIATKLATIREKDPVAFQFIEGKKEFVDCEFQLIDGKIRFIFPNGYDRCHELIIDPVLIFSTYSGSEADNWGSTATPGEHGVLYSAGVTNHFFGNIFSGDFPATPGAFDTSYGGLFDIGILKYDSTGGELLYASYLGGAGSESAHSLVVNSRNELVLFGTTSSSNFPTSDGAFDRLFDAGPEVTAAGISYLDGSDMILVKISPDGKELLASSFIGGSGNDGLNNQSSPLRTNYGDEMRGDVITDSDGYIYLSTVTSSMDFPVRNSFNTTYRGGDSDAVVMKFDGDISEMIWGAFVGGGDDDAANTIKLDSDGNIFVAGGTASDDLPTTENAFMSDFQGEVDGWIAHITTDGDVVLSSTYSGTAWYDQIYFIDLNSGNEVHVFGQTNAGSDFPVLPSATAIYNVPNGGQFLQKFSYDLSTLELSTSFGSGRGEPDISPTAFMVNDCGKIYMAGWGGPLNASSGRWAMSSTVGLEVSADAIQKTTSGSDLYFIVLARDASEFLYGTFLGGNSSKTHVDGGTCRFEKSGIVYHAVCSGCDVLNATGQPSSDFPTTPTAWSRTNESKNCNNAAFKLDLSSLYAIIQTNSTAFDNPGLSFVCRPDSIVFENRSVGGEVYTWDLGDGTPEIVKSTNENVVYAYAAPGTYTVKLTAFDASTCTVQDITWVTVKVFEQNISIQDDDVLCEGSTYELKAAGGIMYQWTSANGNFTSGSPQPVVDPVDTTLYYVKVVDQNACSKEDSVLLSVIPKIVPEFTIKRTEVCEGRPGLEFESKTDSLWVTDEIFFDFGDKSPAVDIEKGTHNYSEDGFYKITMTGRREFCTYENTMTVPVFSLIVPNVITPDASGKNDALTIQFGPNEGTTPANFGFPTKIKIYNRWGTVLYESDNYNFDWTGEGLAAGVYFYEVEIQDHAVCKTWLQIIK